MTLANLKKICAAYHQKTTSDLTIDSVDMFLVAANNVRSNAEMLHNFELSRCQATLTLDGSNGGALSAANIVNGAANSVLVSGTLTPDVTGTYLFQGTGNGGNVYTRLVGSTLYVIYYNGVAFGLVDLIVQSYLWQRALGASSAYTGAYTPIGDSTGTATVTAGSTQFASVKEVIAVSRSTADGFLLPLDFTRSDIVIERDRYEREMSDEWEPMNRYPSDAQTLNRGSNGSIIQRGGTLYVYPVPADSTTDFDVTLECYGRLADYTATNLSDTEPTDFFIEFGSSYLQWAIICELNFLFQTFVIRQEGAVSPPEKARDEAWRNLILWDTYMVDSHSTRSR